MRNSSLFFINVLFGIAVFAALPAYAAMTALGGAVEEQVGYADGFIDLPIHEHLNDHNAVNPVGKPFRQVQLGEGFFANVPVVWTYRDAPDY